MAEFPFLWLDNIPLCIYVYLSHNLFTYSSVDGHLGCFHVLAVVSNAAMSMGVQVFLWLSAFVSFRYSPRNGNAGSHDSSISHCLRKLHTVFQSSLTSLRSYQHYTGFPFLHILANTYLCLFNDSHSNRHGVIRSLWLWFTFPSIISDVLAGHSYSFFGKASIQVLCLFNLL